MFLGNISLPKTLSYLDNDLIYVASCVGDSQLIKLCYKSNRTAPSIKVLNTFLNLGPITDMCIVDVKNRGFGNIVTCSGTYLYICAVQIFKNYALQSFLLTVYIFFNIFKIM